MFAITDLSVRTEASLLKPARTIVAGVTLALREGEVVAILGRSGVGKTVLWRAMFGLNSPGLVVDYRHRVPALSEADLERWRRSSVVFVHQSPQRSVDPQLSLDDYLRRLFARSELHAARDRFQVATAALGLVLGRDALGRQIRTFSGGEVQRIALALRLAGKPRIVVLDEPSAALDFQVAQRTKALVATIVERFSVAVICVTHDYHFIAGLAQRAFYLDNGSATEMDLATGTSASAEARDWLTISQREASEYVRFFGETTDIPPENLVRVPIRMTHPGAVDAR